LQKMMKYYLLNSPDPTEPRGNDTTQFGGNHNLSLTCLGVHQQKVWQTPYLIFSCSDWSEVKTCGFECLQCGQGMVGTAKAKPLKSLYMQWT